MKELTEKIEFSLSKINKSLMLEIHQGLLDNFQRKDLACYFKLPMFFLKSGQFDLANKVLDFIFKKFLMNDGDFKTKPNLKSEKQEYIEYWSYFNGWILRAACLLNYEVPSKALHYFQSLHLGQGKFFSHHPKDIGYGTTDVLTIAHHGLFYLDAGNKNLSDKASQSLYAAFDAQLDLRTKFLLRFDKQAQSINEYTTEQQLLFSVHRNCGRDQLYFMLAYPCAFLGLHYKKTENIKSLEYAKHYMAFLLNCDERVFTSRFSHKTAWAASILYAVTGEQIYLNIAKRIINFFINIQSECGIWFKEEGASVYLDQTAEIGCWFSEILKNFNSSHDKEFQIGK